jgi:hypothetical protein
MPSTLKREGSETYSIQMFRNENAAKPRTQYVDTMNGNGTYKRELTCKK